MNSLKHQKIAILGAGRSGRAAARLALREGGEVMVFDSAPAERLAHFPEDLPLCAGATAADGASFEADLVVVSPGIPGECDFVQAFTRGTAKLIGEVELAAPLFKGKIVGITGTNGKTTTTELVHRMLCAAGLNAQPCGNYGVPFAEILLEHPDCNAVALELSSFQLETIDTLHPDVSVWLNFSPDHMDRYSEVEEYHAAKRRIFSNQTAADTAIIRSGEKVGLVAAKKISFNSEEDGSDFQLKGDMITFQGQSVLDLATSRMRGKHNAENCMAALGVLHALGLPLEAGRTAAEGFAPPLHRCELIRTLDGVEWLNDSKATNLHALDSALKSQNRPVILIAGGKDKGLDYTPLRENLTKFATHCIVFGEISDQLADTFKDTVPLEACNSVQEAVLLAQKAAPFGSTVLFSPGTSSFDQFSGYEARGDAFRKAVLELR